MRWDSIEFAMSYLRLLRMEKGFAVPMGKWVRDRNIYMCLIMYWLLSVGEVSSYRIQTHRAVF